MEIFVNNWNFVFDVMIWARRLNVRQGMRNWKGARERFFTYNY